MIQRRVFVSGRVQGVGFRAHAAREAVRYGGLRGWIRNLGDGRVEAVFCGEPEAVLEMVAWCREGPRFAEVTELEVREERPDEKLPLFGVVRG